jgi:hypothetical protein
LAITQNISIVLKHQNNFFYQSLINYHKEERDMTQERWGTFSIIDQKNAGNRNGVDELPFCHKDDSGSCYDRFDNHD